MVVFICKFPFLCGLLKPLSAIYQTDLRVGDYEVKRTLFCHRLPSQG
jgi:hypothetical protein